MSLSVYSDESLCVDGMHHTLCGIWGPPEACDLLRSTLQKHLKCYEIQTIKWSKIRAKKAYIRCVVGILLLTMQWYDTASDRGICLLTGPHISLLYHQMIAELLKNGYHAINMYPDKNLELQRHRPHHIFSHHDIVQQVIPVQIHTEPLLIIADILAGMMREQAQSPHLFTPKGVYDVYLPLRHKVCIRTLWKMYMSGKSGY